MQKYLRHIVISYTLSMTAVLAFGQRDTLNIDEAIAVTGRPTRDSITLRWAPVKLSVWMQGNSLGYDIERYVIARNGGVLSIPERSLLTVSPLKPLPVNQWEPLVMNNRYAAIAAQALYGDKFEIDLSQSDVFSIVNKVRENEQRYSFALFSADMSPTVAKASALFYTDRNVKKGEKYLYRIIIHSKDSLRGSLFISPDDRYELLQPQNLKAEFKGQAVSLRWDKALDNYTAYIVERSTDGRNFTSISDIPLITVSPTEQQETKYEYATDSLKDFSTTYYYRVKGLTPFGEQSPPSEAVNGKGSLSVSDVPFITDGQNIDNRSIQITWEFPERNNAAIKGFSVERSTKPKGNYTPLTTQTPLPPTARIYLDKSPQQVNYYRVTALGLDGLQYRSAIYLAMLVDSIPPVAPVELKATINEEGVVALSWQPNKEQDIYGYRIYRANDEREEGTQITREPVPQSAYTDKVNVKTLSKAVYYNVVAIDKNQNQSALSTTLKIALPDKIKPQSPVLYPVKSDEKGVVLSWEKSGSDDVTQYIIYRKSPDSLEWQRLKVLSASNDSIYQYTDESSEAGITNHYTVTAVDHAGLESEPIASVSGGKIDTGLRASVQWKKPEIKKEQKQVVLKWQYDLTGIKSFRIYRATGESPPTMYRTVTGDKREFTDTILPEKKYTYTILAIFESGKKSELSKEVSVAY